MVRSGAGDGSEVHEDHVAFLRRTRRLPGEDFVRVCLAPEREISPAPEEGERVIFRAPLSLERSGAASVVGTAEGSANTRRVDPRAELQLAMERNAQEAREEREEAAAAKAAQEEAHEAAKAQADAATKAQAYAAAKAQAEEAAHGQTPQLVIPLRAVPPAPEVSAAPEGAGGDQPTMERKGDYHNLRAAAFNSHVRELAQRTADLSESQKANTALQQQLGEAQTALRAKEEECSKVAQERDRLAKKLADQEELHKAALQAAKDSEATLQAEYETQAMNWADTERALNDGYGQIEDMVDEYFPGYAIVASQAIEAHREERRQAGVEIEPNARRSLDEQLLAIQAHLAQLATFRQEANEELVAVRPALIYRAAAIANYTDTSIFIPELNEEGTEMPPDFLAGPLAQCQSSLSSHQSAGHVADACAPLCRHATCLPGLPLVAWMPRAMPRAAPHLSHSVSLSLLPWISPSPRNQAPPSPPLAVAAPTATASPLRQAQELHLLALKPSAEPCMPERPVEPSSSPSSPPTAVDPHRCLIDLSASPSSPSSPSSPLTSPSFMSPPSSWPPQLAHAHVNALSSFPASQRHRL
nr:uncharacterized protein LOC120964838 [Aegilops tauschii subsp. strangulata]